MTAPNAAEAGSVSVDVYPDGSGFEERLRSQTVPAAERVGRQIAQRLAAPIVRQIVQEVTRGVRDAGTRARTEAEKSGREIGNRLGTEIRKAIEAKLRNAIKVRIEADTAGAMQKIRDVEKKVAGLGNGRVRIDIEDAAALTEIRRVQDKINALSGTRVRLDADNSRALAAIRQVETRMAALSSTTVRIRINTGAASADLARVRQEIRSLTGTATVTVNVRVNGANNLRTLERQLTQIGALARTGVNVDARVSGSIEVRRLLADVRALNRISNPIIDVHVTGVMSALADMHTLSSFARTLGTMSPTITVTVNATLALQRLAVILGLAAAVGAQRPTVTVNINITGLIPAQAGLAAVQAQAAGASGSIGFLGAAIAVLALLAIPAVAGLTIAFFGLATAIGVALGGLLVAVVALSGIIGAVQAVSQEQGKAGQSAASLAAKQNAMASAADQVRGAERSLAGALKEVTKAQEDLTRARVEAKQAIEDLNASVRGNALDVRQAILDEAAGKKELDAVLADPTATDDQREQAKITYGQIALNLENLQRQQGRLDEQQKDTAKNGVEGSDQVRQAQDRLLQSQQAVIVAQEQLTAAHRQAAQALRGVEDAGGAAMDTVGKKMAALSPQGREFVRFIVGLKDELLGLRRVAEAGFLPGLQRGIQAFLPMLPQVSTFIGKVATAAGLFIEKILVGLTSPTWQRFFAWLGDIAGPIMSDFADILLALGEGFAELLMAFGSSSQDFVSGLADMARGFADWAKSVTQTQGFKDFLAYAKENGPIVLDVLGKFVLVVLKLAVALAPLAELTLKGLAWLFDWLAKQNPGVLLGIAAGVAAIGAALAIAFGGPVAIAVTLVIAVTAVVGALVWCYKNVAWFKTATDAVWHAIAVTAVWLWQNVLLPIWHGLVWLWTEVVAPAAIWLWREVLVPAWQGIAAAVTWAWTNVVDPVFTAIAVVIRDVVAPLFTWLWHHVVEPAWQGISLAFSIAWAFAQVVFGLWQIAIKILAAVFVWLWETILQPIWHGISALISWTWDQVRPVFEAFGGFIERNVAPAFKRGVSALGQIWDGLREMAKAPIRFVVDTILNHGLLAAYNWVAKKFGVKPDDVQIPIPDWLGGGGSSGAGGGGGKNVAMADGGIVLGRGTGTSDEIMARLSNGEYVIPAAVVRQLGVDFFDWLIGKKRARGDNQKPGDGSEGLAFADGGLVGWIKSAWNTLTDPIGSLKKKAGEALGQVPGGPWIRDIVSGVARSTIGKVVDWLGAKITNLMSADGVYTGPISGNVLAVQDFIRAQNGRPYIWASAGPIGYDCSGIVSSVWNLLHTRLPFSHTFSTMDEARYFPKTNQVGILTAGWANSGERGGGSVGHTAANLAGLPFESTGSRGVHVGVNNGVTPYTSFAHWGSFDDGGLLMPGITVAMNDTGRPERILTDRQWSALSRTGSGGDTYTTVIQPLKADLSIQDLKAYDARRNALARVGRQR